MAIFNSSPPSYQFTASVGTGGAAVYSTTSVTVGSNTYTFPTGAALSEITLINTGAVTCFVGSSGVSATTGIPLKAGEQLTIRGVGHVVAESGSTSWNLHAITASGTTSIEASLATVEATV
jgi:hypothetical protein